MEESAIKFFNQFRGQVTDNINKLKLGKIVEYEPRFNKAKVQLFEPDVLLIEVPVRTRNTSKFIIHSPLQRNDIVLVGFTDTDIESIVLTGKYTGRNSNYKNKLDDAIIIGTMQPFNVELDLEDKIFIGTKDKSNYMEIDNSIDFKGTININDEKLETMIRRIAREIAEEVHGGD